MARIVRYLEELKEWYKKENCVTKDMYGRAEAMAMDLLDDMYEGEEVKEIRVIIHLALSNILILRAQDLVLEELDKQLKELE